MFVVTVACGGERSGCLVGFTTQVSIGPPRFLVCLSVNNHTYRVARNAQVLAVHGLDPEQHDLAELFGGTTGDDVDKFTRCRWAPGPDGVPLLEDCPRRFTGRVVQQVPFGDHVGFLLDPTGVEAAAEHGQLTLKQVLDVAAGHEA
ncbi:MAG: flavin reductase family protein [Actinomycetes bacterium]